MMGPQAMRRTGVLEPDTGRSARPVWALQPTAPTDCDAHAITSARSSDRIVVAQRMLDVTGNVPGCDAVDASTIRVRTPMRSVCSTLASLLLAAGLSACFTEQPFADTGMIGSSSDGGTDCNAGALGCACYGNDTCDPMLECAAPTGTCVPAGCELGQVHCLCDNDSCDGPLVCVAGICAAPSDSSDDGSSSVSPDTSAGPSSSTASTEGSSDETGPDPVTTSVDDTSGETSSESGPGIVCDDLACGDCAECVVEDGQACAALYDACEGMEACPPIASCMAYCGTTGLCLDDCCAGEPGGAIAAAIAVNNCRQDACPTSCVDYQNPVCSP